MPVRVAHLLPAGLALWLASSPAPGQEAADTLDLSGEWYTDTELLRITQDGSSVRVEFFQGAECFDGAVRPYLLEGELSGSVLDGEMVVCSSNPRIVEECPLESSMYETTFKATAETDYITGTRIAQGMTADQQDGRYTNCIIDRRYNQEVTFALTRGCNPNLWDEYRRKEATALELLGHSRDLMRAGTAEAEDFVLAALESSIGQVVGDLALADAVEQSKRHYLNELGKLVEDVRLLGNDQVRALSYGHRSAVAAGVASKLATMAFIADQLYRGIDTMRRIEAIHAEGREATERAADLLESGLRDFIQAMDQFEACAEERRRLRDEQREAEEFVERAKALRDEWDLGTGLYRDAEGNIHDAASALQRAEEILRGLDAAATPAAAEEATRTSIDQLRAAAEALAPGFDSFAEAIRRAEALEARLEELIESRSPAEPLPVG